MPSREWADAPYVRVYVTLGEDHPAIWSDLRLLGAYVRLLVAADRAWPGRAEVPRGMPPDVLAALEADEVVDLAGDFYRFHGLEAERSGRVKGAAIGGKARAALAQRDEHGRFLPADDEPEDMPLADPLDERSVTAGVVAGTNGSSGRLATAAGGPADQRHDTRRDEPTGLVSGRAPARAPAHTRADASARPAPAPSQIRCDDYQAHRAEHRWWPGIGWRCATCEAKRADDDNDAGLTFSEKVRRATPPEGSHF